MNLHGVVINVAHLDRSISFYQDVLGFSVLSREDQVAAMDASGDDQTQIVVLREFGTSPLGGARHIGLRAFAVEVDDAQQFERIVRTLHSSGHLVNRLDRSEWTAVVARDPDGVSVVVVSSPDGGRITKESWKTLDDVVYGIGE